MKLDEINSLDKASVITSMVKKLLDRGVLVRMDTFDREGKPFRGVVTGFDGKNVAFLLDGENNEEDTAVRHSELSNAKLTSNDDGSYTFYFPNADVELDGPAPPRRKK